MSNVHKLTVITGGDSQEERDSAAADLEEVAAQIRAGEVTEYAIVYVGEHYTTRFWASRFNGLGLAALLHESAVNRMKRSEP